MDVLNHNFIRLGLTRAKALRTASRFSKRNTPSLRCTEIKCVNPARLTTIVCIICRLYDIHYMICGKKTPARHFRHRLKRPQMVTE
jgi:hypothetical protein